MRSGRKLEDGKNVNSNERASAEGVMEINNSSRWWKREPWLHEGVMEILDMFGHAGKSN